MILAANSSYLHDVAPLRVKRLPCPSWSGRSRADVTPHDIDTGQSDMNGRAGGRRHFNADMMTEKPTPSVRCIEASCPSVYLAATI
jgi:hypothetical protein